MLLFFLPWLAWAVFQGVQLWRDHQVLTALHAGQQAQVDQAQRVRQTLDALATETSKLAQAGNRNAGRVIEELRRRGVTVVGAAPAARE